MVSLKIQPIYNWGCAPPITLRTEKPVRPRAGLDASKKEESLVPAGGSTLRLKEKTVLDIDACYIFIYKCFFETLFVPINFNGLQARRLQKRTLSLDVLIILNSTFRGPCIVIYSKNKNNEMH